jgi:hypothetical protein
MLQFTKETYGGSAFDGDLDKNSALGLALSPLETGWWVVDVDTVPPFELKSVSQLFKYQTVKTGKYTGASKTSWRADFEIFDGLDGSLARAFLGLSRVGLKWGSH